MNSKLTKNPGRIAFSSKVPLIAANINASPKKAKILFHILNSRIRNEEIMIKNQLYNSKIPAAVVIYSYIFPGSSKAVMIDASKPTVANPNDGRGRLLNLSSFLANIAGASPPFANVTSKLVTPYKEAVIVENPAMMIAPLNT